MKIELENECNEIDYKLENLKFFEHLCDERKKIDLSKIRNELNLKNDLDQAIKKGCKNISNIPKDSH